MDYYNLDSLLSEVKNILCTQYFDSKECEAYFGMKFEKDGNFNFVYQRADELEEGDARDSLNYIMCLQSREKENPSVEAIDHYIEIDNVNDLELIKKWSISVYMEIFWIQMICNI